MKILTKAELKKLMEQYPDGGIVFADYYPAFETLGRVHVTNGSFRARTIVPCDHSWNIDNYASDESFAVFDNNDILQMIQTLTSGLKIDLTFDFSEGVKI